MSHTLAQQKYTVEEEQKYIYFYLWQGNHWETRYVPKRVKKQVQLVASMEFRSQQLKRHLSELLGSYSYVAKWVFIKSIICVSQSQQADQVLKKYERTDCSRHKARIIFHC